MKKAYVKPMMEVESFSLSQSIAGSCSHLNIGKANFGGPATCQYESSLGSFFYAGSCSDEISDGADYGSFCYNPSNPASTLFHS